MNDINNVIVSRNNPLITRISKLADKKYRDSERLFGIEGIKLAEEAILCGVEIEYIFFTENCNIFENKVLNCRKFVVSDNVYSKISNEKSPQGVFCVVKYIDNFHKKVKIYNTDPNSGRIFICSSIRDPGNLGTVIRTAAAFGIGELILSHDCADIYNPKTIRASMGALFRQRITIVDDIKQAAVNLRRSGYTVYAAALSEDSLDIRKVNVDAKTCFAVGNEGHGLDSDFISICDGTVTIPMTMGTESLNAASASAILMWEGYTNEYENENGDGDGKYQQ